VFLKGMAVFQKEKTAANGQDNTHEMVGSSPLTALVLALHPLACNKGRLVGSRTVLQMCKAPVKDHTHELCRAKPPPPPKCHGSLAPTADLTYRVQLRNKVQQS